jgi:hypothetical protein
MGFKRAWRDINNPNSRFRKSLTKWGTSIDHAATRVGNVVKTVGPALAFAVPETAPAVGGAIAAAQSYDNLRRAVKGS